jgi:ubiquinone/menaquinone biosynthesis C-methylase UbiE
MIKHARDTAAQFSRQAEAYARSPSHARGGDLDILLDFARPAAGETCLDLATGPGHTAFRLAAAAGTVAGFDIAPGMIEVARRRAAETGVGNLRFLVGDVHTLPFPAASFDLVTCRIAPHHFADVPAALAEAARVLIPAGRLVIEDSLAPDEPAAAAFLEELEVQRDPTHVHTLSHDEWRKACAATGLRMVRETIYRKRHDFDAWIGRTGLPAAEIEAISQNILTASGPVRDSLFEIEDGRVRVLGDRKLIFRAEL